MKVKQTDEEKHHHQAHHHPPHSPVQGIQFVKRVWQHVKQADAEAARVKAEQMLAAHQQQLDAVQDEVKEILAEARRDAAQTGQRIVSEAQGQTDTMKNRALAEIERSKDQALKELFDAMAGQVATATEYVLGHGLNADDQDRLIQEALAQLGNGAETT